MYWVLDVYYSEDYRRITSQTIQQMVDMAPEAEVYYTDGYSGYLDVVFPGEHIYNIHNKNDTFTAEGLVIQLIL